MSAMPFAEPTPAAAQAEEWAAATPHSTSNAPYTNEPEEAVPIHASVSSLASETSPTTAAVMATTDTLVITVGTTRGAASPSASAHASSPSSATLKQHQRLLARRHLGLSRRAHPRMSTLEAKLVVCRFNACVSGVSLAEKLLADESVFWEESVASVRRQ